MSDLHSNQIHYMRQNDRLPLIRCLAFNADVLVDLTVFTGGIIFKMVGPATKTGAAVGDAVGNLSYTWAANDCATVGEYDAVFIATDGTGRTQTFPTGTNLRVIVIAAI